MPVEWDRRAFERFYGRGEGGYSRAFWCRFQGDVEPERSWWADVAEQRVAPEVDTRESILVVGCGLGLLLEELVDLGYEDVWGIDKGPYLPSLWKSEARADVRFKLTRADVRDLSSGYDTVITESVIESYAPGQEQGEIYDACERLGGRIIHLVYPNIDMTHWPSYANESWAGEPLPSGATGCPPRTMDEWRESRPSHTFLSLEGI